MWNLPFSILAAFIFSIPWQDVVYVPGSLPISRILGVLLIVAGLGSMLRGRSIKLRNPSLMLFLAVLFVFWAVLSNLWTINVSRGLTQSLIYVQLVIMVWLIWELCRTKKQHLILVQAFVLGAYVLAGSTVYGFLTNPFEPNSMQSMERYTGIGGNPNDIGAIMALALPMAWHLSLLQRSGWLRWLNLSYLPVAVLGVVLTASRGGAVIAVVGLAAIPLTYNYANRSRRIVFAVALGIMAIVVFNLVPPENFLRLAATSAEISEGNVSNRSQIWQAGLEAYSEQPLLGVGVGSFSQATTPFLGYRAVAHNVFVNILTEMGVVGLTLFVSLILVTLLPLLRLPAPDRIVYSFLWLALVISLLPSNHEDAQHVWALLVILTTRSAYILTFSEPARLLSKAPRKLRKVLGRGRYL